MENKRFTIEIEYEKSITSNIDGDYALYYILDNQTDTQIGNVSNNDSRDLVEFCSLLNELHEENQRLKEQLERLAKP